MTPSRAGSHGYPLAYAGRVVALTVFGGGVIQRGEKILHICRTGFADHRAQIAVGTSRHRRICAPRFTLPHTQSASFPIIHGDVIQVSADD